MTTTYWVHHEAAFPDQPDEYVGSWDDRPTAEKWMDEWLPWCTIIETERTLEEMQAEAARIEAKIGAPAVLLYTIEDTEEYLKKRV